MSRIDRSYYYVNGQLARETQYKNEKKHGIEIWWHHFGKIKSERAYMNGMPCGTHRQYFSNRRLEYEVPYDNDGNYHGVLKIWYSNGNLRHEEQYENGKNMVYLEYGTKTVN